jgi:hypothetical protein
VSATLTPQGRDAYWRATQTELNSIRKRGDRVAMWGAALLFALIYVFRDHLQEPRAWLIAGTLLLGVVGTSLWVVTSRRRRLAIARGLVCRHCDYMPHDTEIDEVAATRTCPHCEKSLDA